MTKPKRQEADTKNRGDQLNPEHAAFHRGRGASPEEAKELASDVGQRTRDVRANEQAGE